MINLKGTIESLAGKYGINLNDFNEYDTWQNQVAKRLKKEKNRVSIINSHLILFPLLMLALSLSSYLEIIASIEFKIACVVITSCGLIFVLSLIIWKKKRLIAVTELYILRECLELYKKGLKEEK